MREKYGQGKNVAARVTLEHPELLEAYRRDKGARPPVPLSHEDLISEEGAPQTDWDALLQAVLDVPTGRDGADAYHKAIQGLLTALFGPYLVHPEREFKIHDGRKRIDITYTNAAHDGFFRLFAQHHPAALVMVECKNYGREVGNPELDQLAGRFSPNRGKLGILTCRSFENKPLFNERCRDTVRDDRGFILAIDDEDLSALVKARKNEDYRTMWNHLREKYNYLLT